MHYMQRDIMSPCPETTEVSSLQEIPVHFGEKARLHVGHEYEDKVC